MSYVDRRYKPLNTPECACSLRIETLFVSRMLCDDYCSEFLIFTFSSFKLLQHYKYNKFIENMNMMLSLKRRLIFPETSWFTSSEERENRKFWTTITRIKCAVRSRRTLWLNPLSLSVDRSASPGQHDHTLTSGAWKQAVLLPPPGQPPPLQNWYFFHFHFHFHYLIKLDVQNYYCISLGDVLMVVVIRCYQK